jgi:hypothetical protein
MASKLMKSREVQLTVWEKKLSQRKEILVAKGRSVAEIEKDTVVRSIKSKIKETKARIKAINAKEAKLVEMAKVREEKKAAPPKEKGKKVAEEAAAPKESKKKAKAAEKKEGKEPKAEKPKKEPKTAAPEAAKE